MAKIKEIKIYKKIKALITEKVHEYAVFFNFILKSSQKISYGRACTFMDFIWFIVSITTKKYLKSFFI